jgi:hypothetical protein
VPERWTPALSVRDHGGRCRLVLAGLAFGDGSTLQDAVDDLVARLQNLLFCVRANGLPQAPDLGPLDPRTVEFVWELSQQVHSRRELRARLF